MSVFYSRARSPSDVNSFERVLMDGTRHYTSRAPNGSLNSLRHLCCFCQNGFIT
jgi:hypothetical protein